MQPGTTAPPQEPPAPAFFATNFTLTGAVALFDALDTLASKKVPVAAPCATEPLGQNYGFTLFSSAAPSVGNATVEVNQVRDRAQVFVDGKRLRWARDAAGRLSASPHGHSLAGGLHECNRCAGRNNVPREPRGHLRGRRQGRGQGGHPGGEHGSHQLWPRHDRSQGEDGEGKGPGVGGKPDAQGDAWEQRWCAAHFLRSPSQFPCCLRFFFKGVLGPVTWNAKNFTSWTASLLPLAPQDVAKLSFGKLPPKVTSPTFFQGTFTAPSSEVPAARPCWGIYVSAEQCTHVCRPPCAALRRRQHVLLHARLGQRPGVGQRL